MISIEEQLLEAQNQLLVYKKEEMSNAMKLDELSERADFYESLHNKEQRDLYEIENKYTALKGKLSEKRKEIDELVRDSEEKSKEIDKLVRDIEEKGKEIAELTRKLEERSLDNTGTKQLIAVLVRRLRYKFTGR